MTGNTRPLGHIRPHKNTHPVPDNFFDMPRAPTLHTKRARKSPPPNESKRDRFKRLALTRMRNALYAIRLIGNLSTSEIYESTEDDVARIHATLLDAVSESTNRFKKKRPVITFELMS